MKPVPPEKYRVTASVAAKLGWSPAIASTAAHGMSGMFVLQNPFARQTKFGPGFDGLIRCVVHDGSDEGEGWEHVSASFDHRCPSWEEMCFVKSTFWCDDEIAVQFHPAKSEHVNAHPYTLHLWRHPSINTPPKKFV